MAGIKCPPDLPPAPSVPAQPDGGWPSPGSTRPTVDPPPEGASSRTSHPGRIECKRSSRARSKRSSLLVPEFKAIGMEMDRRYLVRDRELGRQSSDNHHHQIAGRDAMSADRTR